MTTEDISPVGRVVLEVQFDPDVIKSRKDIRDEKTRYRGEYGTNDIAIYPGELVFYHPKKVRGFNESRIPKVFSNFVGMTQEEAEECIFFGICTGSGKTPNKEGNYQELMIATIIGGRVTLTNSSDKMMCIGDTLLWEKPDIDIEGGRHLAKLRVMDTTKEFFTESDFLDNYKDISANLETKVKEMKKKEGFSKVDEPAILSLLYVREINKKSMNLKRHVIGSITRGAEKGEKIDAVMGHYAC